ncbi:MAG TPA: hypothetical protein VHD37_03265 [Candidatus Paceibacterota bacterium]|nr:hypothetical protein [Candidatus Paceibacterota bacterium]
MHQKLTHYAVLGLQDTLRVGDDILLLPGQTPHPYEEARALANAGVIPQSESVIVDAVWKIEILFVDYADERERTGKEPAWVERMPISVRTYLRYQYVTTSWDTYVNVPSLLPGLRKDRDRFDVQPTMATALSYHIVANGLCQKTEQAFGLMRLSRIKQLGFLNAPPYNSYTQMRQPLSEGTRWLHSLDVYATATIIGHNMRLPRGKLNTLGVLALTHDVRTPAGGDSVKMVDLAALDEDATYHLTLEKMDMSELERDFEVNREDLLEGIHNRGLLGEILDIADKLAYIARDISKCLHHIEAGAQREQYGLITLLRLLHQFPYVCNVWDCVEASEDGHAYFTDAGRLVAFLKVRVLMFRELYFHPLSRFGEFFMSRLFVKMLYDKGVLTSDMLLKMDDGQLDAFLDEYFGERRVLDQCSSEVARVKSFATPGAAEAFVHELKSQGKRFVMTDDYRRAIKTGVHFLVATPEGPKPLREADPGSARELEEMATLLPMVHVYYLEDDPDLPKERIDELVAYIDANAVRRP